MLDGVLDQLRVVLQSQIMHHPVLVKFRRPGGDVQNGCDLFGRSALRQQLKDFPLPGGELNDWFS